MFGMPSLNAVGGERKEAQKGMKRYKKEACTAGL
jgi:hypothetical protein